MSFEYSVRLGKDELKVTIRGDFSVSISNGQGYDVISSNLKLAADNYYSEIKNSGLYHTFNELMHNVLAGKGQPNLEFRGILLFQLADRSYVYILNDGSILFIRWVGDEYEYFNLLKPTKATLHAATVRFYSEPGLRECALDNITTIFNIEDRDIRLYRILLGE